MAKLKWIKLLLIFLGIFAVAGWLIVEHVLPYAAIKRPHNISYWKMEGMQAEELLVQNDGIRLKTYFIPAKTEAQATIILLHGIGGHRGHFVGFAPKLAAMGCNVVLVDLRAHGESNGIYCTFGHYEKYDIQRIIEVLEQKGVKQPIGIFGASLGGAIAIQSIALDKRLKFGIIESTFNTYENVVTEYWLGIRSTWLTHHVLEKAGKIANFPPFEIKPVEDCRRIEVPMFMAHGTADDRIPFSFGLDNFNAVQCTDKTWYPIQDANHLNVHKMGGDAYFEQIKTFILRQAKQVVTTQH